LIDTRHHSSTLTRRATLNTPNKIMCEINTLWWSRRETKLCISSHSIQI